MLGAAAEPESVGRRRSSGAAWSLCGGSVSFLGALFEAVAEAPGLGAGVDDVRAVGEPVDDGLREPCVGEHLGLFTEWEVGGDDQAGSLVALGEDLEDELGCAVGEREVAELVEHQQLGAGVFADDA
jgi:hypothetical protein